LKLIGLTVLQIVPQRTIGFSILEPVGFAIRKTHDMRGATLGLSRLIAFAVMCSACATPHVEGSATTERQFGSPSIEAVAEVDPAVNRYGVTPDRAAEIAGWRRETSRILERFYRITDNWADDRISWGGTKDAPDLSAGSIQLDIWAKDPDDEQFVEIVDALEGVSVNGVTVPIVVHEVPRSFKDLQALEDAEKERRDEPVDIAWDVETGTLLILPAEEPRYEGWEAAEQDSSVWWLQEVDGRRITVVAEAGGSDCTRFSHLEVTESATAVEVLAIWDLSQRGATGGSCFADRVGATAEAVLAEPLGSRRLTGCQLGAWPIDERTDCREFVEQP
jgi:hypothetical protein